MNFPFISLSSPKIAEITITVLLPSWPTTPLIRTVTNKNFIHDIYPQFTPTRSLFQWFYLNIDCNFIHNLKTS